jgi:hypothetical protein
MGRDELPGGLAFRLIAQARQQVAARIVDAHPRPQSERLRIGANGGAEFADIGQRCRLWVVRLDSRVLAPATDVHPEMQTRASYDACPRCGRHLYRSQRLRRR